MIPQAEVTEWRAQAPWASAADVEQDLVISRAIVRPTRARARPSFRREHATMRRDQGSKRLLGLERCLPFGYDS